MVHDHVSRIMHHFLQRGVELEQEELTRCSEKFFQADSKPFVANLLAYVLGQTPDDLKSFEMFHSPNLLTDRKLYGQLEKMVNLMPTLEFQLIPLVMVYNGEMQTAFVVRVRKLPQSNECVYVDLTLRTYKSFDQFLDSNRLPESKLWYPSGGLLQYEQDAPIPKIQIESRLIKRTGAIWKGIAIAGTGVATILAFTPLGLAVTAPLLFVTSVPTLGFSIADLVDGVKHERNTVVAQRSLALGFSLMTFASAGLTSICRLEKLRRMVPTDVLLKLEKAEQLLAASRRWVSVTEVTVSIIGNSNGWKEIPKEDWIRMGSLLCFAFRESFSDETAIRLYGLMQKNGVLKFFRELCPNVLYETMRAKVCGPLFGKFLRFVVDYLQKGVEFTVDDRFTTITLFGHEFQFEMLFAVNWELMQSLLLVVQRSGHTIGQLFMGLRDSEPFTQDMLNNVLELLGLISRLGDISCTLADYIIIGPGHHYTVRTVRTFLATENLARVEILRALAQLTPAEAEQLNALRREPGSVEGGDDALFTWLASHSSVEYGTALKGLVAVAAATATKTSNEKPKPIRFDAKFIAIGPLQAFLAQEVISVPEESRASLLLQERFQQLCHSANQQLLARANRVWMRTCGNSPAGLTRGLETLALLEQLFQRFPNRAGLPKALEYALNFDGATVHLVYYVIVFAWNYTTNPSHLREQTMKSRFGQLMTEARRLQMVRYTARSRPAMPCGDGGEGYDEQSIVSLARTVLPEQSGGNVPPFPFGTAERAACWLHLMPALRNAAVRDHIQAVLRNLLEHGSAKVMNRADRTVDQLAAAARMVMFVLGDDKIVVEVLPPIEPGKSEQWLLSFYLCGGSIPRVGA